MRSIFIPHPSHRYALRSASVSGSGAVNFLLSLLPNPRVEGDRIYETRNENDFNALARKVEIEVAAETLDRDDARKSLLGSEKVFSELQAEMAEGKELLFLIHGYDYTFRQAVARAAQLKQFYGARPLAMLLFTWPSLGQGVSGKSYDDERKRAEASGAAIGRTFLKAVDFLRARRREGPCLQRIHLMAHSMGNWTLRGAIQYARTFTGDNLPPLLDEVLLVAADEDDDTLSVRHKLQPLLRACRRVTVYYNQQDVALKGSDVVMGNPDRLGLCGAEDSDRRPAKVVQVSVSPAINWEKKDGLEDWQVDQTGHQYYRNNELISDDLLRVLGSRATDEFSERKRRDGYWRLG